MFRCDPILVPVLAMVLGAGQAQVQKSDEKATERASAPAVEVNEVAVIKTTKGEMVLEFWSDVAPRTVANFKKIARAGSYDGTALHRIVRGFMVQGGDPLTKDPAAEERYGTGNPGYKIKAEFNNRPHERGVISMARNGDPLEAQGLPPRPQFADSAGSQFFICLDEAPHLNGKYTAFGKLSTGIDILLTIGNTPTKWNRLGTEKSVPVERIGVESIKIVPADSIKPVK